MNHELFARIHEVINLFGKVEAKTLNKVVYETLLLVCHEGLRGTGQAYGNLFSRVDILCRKCNLRMPDRKAVDALRRHANGKEEFSRDDFFYGMRALSRLVSAVTGSDVPGQLLRLLPANDRAYTPAAGLDVRYVRCIVSRWDTLYIYVSAEKGLDDSNLAVDCSAEDLAYLRKMLREGMQLNLLDCKLTEAAAALPCGAQKVLTPGLVVVEPDYLVSISTIAACFKDYGNHPLTYTIDRMRPRANSSAILLGNLAGDVLDNVVNQGSAFSLSDTVRSNFTDNAVDYASCADFDAPVFMSAIRGQAANIVEAVKVMFADHDRGKVILEPSFICERLGMQGRVDMMTTDFRLLVEQKSGKNRNIQLGRPGSHGSVQLEPHYVQVLLYYGVLRYNFNLSFDRTDIRLLYSKYPPDQGHVAVAFYRKLFREAVKLRNMIVATDFMIARDGFERLLPCLVPATVNTAGLSSDYYNRWLLPQIAAVTQPLQSLAPLERDYFCRMATFACREQLMAKVGGNDGAGGCTADLWNMPLAEKIETGNIYVGLTITAKAAGKEGGAPDMITLSVPSQGEGSLPNFRRGDMVYLYQYRRGEEPDVRRSILYKGTIVALHTAEITVALANGQKNPNILTADGSLYAVEHAGGDAVADGALRALHEFVTAPLSRRALLLGQRAPRADASRSLTRSYSKDYDDVLLRVKQAQDCFMLVGPPGTGKTSMAIRFIVEEALADPQASVLLMAYTNRAVDELCAMLDSASIDYIRIGGEYSVDPHCLPHLLSQRVKLSPQLSSVRRQIAAARVVTATTSMLMSHPSVFDIKRFSLAVVDEASQILEPGIVGLLAAHRPYGGSSSRCCIDKFVLVGDHKQLPAVVRQSEEESAVSSPLLRAVCLDNCRNSLFYRMLRLERQAGRTAFTGVLRRHGRMHPDIAYFPCHEFYGSEHLVPVPLPHQQETALPYADIGVADRLDLVLRSHRMVFIPSRLCRRPDVSDKVNTSEAVIVAQVLRRIRLMLGDGFTPRKSVGVIVPYRNQIAVIRKELEKFAIPELEAVSIDTVERYQGSQRDVIIYSFTVQNAWQLDFLAGSCFTEGDRIIDRKLNVALTRSRRQLIMTGNVDILSTNSLFRKLLDYIRDKGGICEVNS